MATQEEISRDCVKKTLLKSTRVLCDNLRPDNMLLTLLAEGAVGQNDVTKIKKKDTSTEQVETLIEILTKSSVSSYQVFMKALREERPDLYTDVKAIEENESGVSSQNPTSTSAAISPRAQKVSQQDIFKITVKAGLTKAHLDMLFMALDITPADIDNGRMNANTTDFKLQSSSVLRDGWLQKKGNAATRQVILDALRDIEATNALEYLEKQW